MDIRDFASLIIFIIFADILFYVVVMKGLMVQSITGSSPSDTSDNPRDENAPTFTLTLIHTPPVKSWSAVVRGNYEGNLAEQALDFNVLMRQEMENLDIEDIRFISPYDLKAGQTKRLEMQVIGDILKSMTQALNRASRSNITALRVGALVRVSLVAKDFKIVALTDEELRLDDSPQQWAWDVTPLKSGVRTFGLDISVKLMIASGEEEKVYSWRDGEVQIEASPLFTLKRLFRK